MKEQFFYTTRGVGSRGIEVTIDDGIVTAIRFIGGCSGNTQGVASLAVGMTPEAIVKRIKGIKCGPKSTSCPDQLATALEEYISKKEA